MEWPGIYIELFYSYWPLKRHYTVRHSQSFSHINSQRNFLWTFKHYTHFASHLISMFMRYICQSTSWLTYVSTVLKPLTDCVNVGPSCVDQQPTETTKVSQLKPLGDRRKEHLLTFWQPPVVTENECFPIATLTGCSLALGEISWKAGAALKRPLWLLWLQAGCCSHPFVCMKDPNLSANSYHFTLLLERNLKKVKSKLETENVGANFTLKANGLH